MRCKQCPSDMSLETVDGEKRWVCADCGYTCAHEETGGFSVPKPLLIGAIVVIAIALLAVFGQ